MSKVLRPVGYAVLPILSMVLAAGAHAAVTLNVSSPAELVVNIFNEGSGSLTIAPMAVDAGPLFPSIPLGKSIVSYLVKLHNPVASLLTPYSLEVDFGGKILGIQTLHPGIRAGRFQLKAEPDFSPAAPEGGLEPGQGDVATISGSVLNVSGKVTRFDSIRVIVQCVPEAATIFTWTGVVLGGVFALRSSRRPDGA